MTAHPGSKRRFRRLRVVCDSQGVQHVIWPARKRRGRQARPMPAFRREAHYRRQRYGAPPWLSDVRPLTGPQQRRVRHKANQAMSREAS